MIKLSLICTPGIQNSAQLRTHTHLPPWEKPNLVVPAIVVGWPSCLDHKHFLLLLHSTHRIGFHLNPHFHFMKLILLLHLATQKVVSTMASLILPSVFPSFSLLLANQFLPPPYSYQCFPYSQLPLSLQSHNSSQSIKFFVPVIIKMVVALCFFCFLTIASFSNTLISWSLDLLMVLVHHGMLLPHNAPCFPPPYQK